VIVMGEVDGRSLSGLALLFAGLGRAKLIFALCSVLAVCAPFDWVAAAASGHDYRPCFGYYALCDASTCTPIDMETVTVNVINKDTPNTTAEFPDADCTCPILYGQATADVNGGQMSGTCAPPAPDQVWTIWSNAKFVPQAKNGWAQSRHLARIKKQICKADLGLGDQSVNCFGFKCDSLTFINSVAVVTCHCALGEDFSGRAVPAYTAFWTNAGQADPAFCSKNPAATPLPFTPKRNN